MSQFTRRAALLGTGTAMLVGARSAAADDSQLRLIERARLALGEFLDDTNFAMMRTFIQNAQAALIFPELLKAGLIVGVGAGSGVMLVRDEGNGAWSNPAFYDLYQGSFGAQIGGSATKLVLAVMNRPAIDKILTSKFKLGTDASIAAGPVGAGVGAGTTARFGEDVYSFSRSKGLYIGLSLEGAAILPKTDWNEAFYGVKTTPARILRGEAGTKPESQPLRDELARF